MFKKSRIPNMHPKHSKSVSTSFLLELSLRIKKIHQEIWFLHSNQNFSPRGIFKGERTIKSGSTNNFLLHLEMCFYSIQNFLRRFFCIISLVHMYLPFHCTKIFVNQHLIPIQCIGNSELVGIYKRKINIRNKWNFQNFKNICPFKVFGFFFIIRYKRS